MKNMKVFKHIKRTSPMNRHPSQTSQNSSANRSCIFCKEEVLLPVPKQKIDMSTRNPDTGLSSRKPDMQSVPEYLMDYSTCQPSVPQTKAMASTLVGSRESASVS